MTRVRAAIEANSASIAHRRVLLDANANAVQDVQVSTSTQDGQSVGSAVTKGRGDYAINDVTSGLSYITLNPPAGTDLRGQSVASYVGGMGLTVNWGVAPGRDRWPRRCPGSTTATPVISAIASACQAQRSAAGFANGCPDRPADPRSPRSDATTTARATTSTTAIDFGPSAPMSIANVSSLGLRSCAGAVLQNQSPLM